jgi:hypothetical protein
VSTFKTISRCGLKCIILTDETRLNNILKKWFLYPRKTKRIYVTKVSRLMMFMEVTAQDYNLLGRDTVLQLRKQVVTFQMNLLPPSSEYSSILMRHQVRPKRRYLSAKLQSVTS